MLLAAGLRSDSLGAWVLHQTLARDVFKNCWLGERRMKCRSSGPDEARCCRRTSILLLNFITFWQSVRWPSGAPSKDITVRSIKAKLVKWPRYFAYSFPKFYRGGSKVRNLASIFHTSRLWLTILLKRNNIFEIWKKFRRPANGQQTFVELWTQSTQPSIARFWNSPTMPKNGWQNVLIINNAGTLYPTVLKFNTLAQYGTPRLLSKSTSGQIQDGEWPQIFSLEIAITPPRIVLFR